MYTCQEIDQDKLRAYLIRVGKSVATEQYSSWTYRTWRIPVPVWQHDCVSVQADNLPARWYWAKWSSSRTTPESSSLSPTDRDWQQATGRTVSLCTLLIIHSKSGQIGCETHPSRRESGVWEPDSVWAPGHGWCSRAGGRWEECRWHSKAYKTLAPRPTVEQWYHNLYMHNRTVSKCMVNAYVCIVNVYVTECTM